jgi:hypothetical protein
VGLEGQLMTYHGHAVGATPLFRASAGTVSVPVRVAPVAQQASAEIRTAPSMTPVRFSRATAGAMRTPPPRPTALMSRPERATLYRPGMLRPTTLRTLPPLPTFPVAPYRPLRTLPPLALPMRAPLAPLRTLPPLTLTPRPASRSRRRRSRSRRRRTMF